MGGFHYLMMLYFLYSYAVRLEREEFAGKPADMAYMLLIMGISSSKFRELKSNISSSLTSINSCC